MVNYFSDKAGELPGGDKVGLLTDSSTWDRLYDTVEALVNDCVLGQGKMGWQMAGTALRLGLKSSSGRGQCLANSPRQQTRHRCFRMGDGLGTRY